MDGGDAECAQTLLQLGGRAGATDDDLSACETSRDSFAASRDSSPHRDDAQRTPAAQRRSIYPPGWGDTPPQGWLEDLELNVQDALHSEVCSLVFDSLIEVGSRRAGSKMREAKAAEAKGFPVSLHSIQGLLEPEPPSAVGATSARTEPTEPGQMAACASKTSRTPPPALADALQSQPNERRRSRRRLALRRRQRQPNL